MIASLVFGVIIGEEERESVPVLLVAPFVPNNYPGFPFKLRHPKALKYVQLAAQFKRETGGGNSTIRTCGIESFTRKRARERRLLPIHLF